MSLVQVQKRRSQLTPHQFTSSAQQQQSSSSSRSSSKLSSSRMQHQTNRKGGLANVSRRPKVHDSQTDNFMMKRARSKNIGSRQLESSTPTVTSSVLVGNLTTDFRMTQERIKTLKAELETENRAYKEALRNSNTCNHDLNNSVAEFNDRRTRLDEVSEVFEDCKRKSRGIDSDQRLLQELIIKAKYDVGCAREAASSMGAAKQEVLLTLLNYLDKTSEACGSVEIQSKNNDLTFNRKQMQHQTDLESKDQQFFHMHNSFESLKERNLALNFTLSEHSSLVETLKHEVSHIDELHSQHKEHSQKLKTDLDSLKKQSQADHTCLNKEVKNANSLLSAANSSLIKISNDEARQRKQKTTIEDENNAKENKLKLNNVDFSSKLKSLQGKIENLETSHSGFYAKVETTKISNQSLDKENSDLIESIESIQTCTDKEVHFLADIEVKLKGVLNLMNECEINFKLFQDKQVSEAKVHFDSLSTNEVELSKLESERCILDNQKKMVEDRVSKLLSKKCDVRGSIQTVDREYEIYTISSNKAENEVHLEETTAKEVAQNSEAVLISLHLEEKEIASAVANIETRLAPTQEKVKILQRAIVDIEVLGQSSRLELLPEHEVEEIKLEVAKRQGLPSQKQHELTSTSGIDKLLTAEKDRHQMFNERKNTIRSNSKVKLEADFSKLDELLEADLKAIAEIQSEFMSLKDQCDDSGSDDEDIEEHPELKVLLERIQKNQSEIDDSINEIENISMTERKLARSPLNVTTLASGIVSSAPAGAEQLFEDYEEMEKHRPKEMSESLDYSQPQEDMLSAEICFEEKVEYSETGTRSKLNVEGNDDNEHEEVDYFFKETSVYPAKKLPSERRKTKTPSSTKPLKPEKPKKSKLVRPQFQQEHKKVIKKQTKPKNNRTSPPSPPPSSTIAQNGPHLIVGEEEDEDEAHMMVKTVDRVKSHSTKKLPVLVPLDERYSVSPRKVNKTVVKTDQSMPTTKTSLSVRGVSVRGVSRSRSPPQNNPTNKWNKTGPKSKSNKNKKGSSKVQQEADWLFSSQDGFSF